MKKELMQAYINGAYGNNTYIPQQTIGALGLHWTATTFSENTNNAWWISPSSGQTSNTNKDNSGFTRCVRPAP